MLALKTLKGQPFRFIMTVTGIALCVILILFLLGIYKGVSVGSVEYVRASDADLWVLQRHATNILRSTSILTPEHGSAIREIPGVKSVAPVFFILASVNTRKGPATLYLAGYNAKETTGGPPEIIEGRNIRQSGEIVLDKAFAAKYHFKTGDHLSIKNEDLKVVGFSKGTNMFVIQYAFITLADAHRIIGMAGIATSYLVKVENGTDPKKISSEIMKLMPDVVVFDRKEFLQNNIHEMESGILPLLFVVAVIGSVVLMAILSLILSIHVLERRKDFAIMKALGAPRVFIPRLIVLHALILSGSGLITGILLFFPLIAGVARLSPEVSVLSSPMQLLAVIFSVIVISLISSVFPNLKLRKIYPLEVFNGTSTSSEIVSKDCFTQRAQCLSQSTQRRKNLISILCELCENALRTLGVPFYHNGDNLPDDKVNQLPEITSPARLSGITKNFHSNGRDSCALKNISFRACPGELVLLLGPSGSGKSTFLTILAGLQAQSSGEAFLFGKAIAHYSARELQQLRAARIGFIFQTFQLIESLTAIENILLVQKFNRTNKKKAKERALQMLERMEILHLGDALPKTMSQGEKQRVALARALANDPALIIADEPTGSLATDQGMNIVKLLKGSSQKENRCVIIASHDQRITNYADRVLCLKDGVLMDN
jgi:putative ABC transport system ATP-binding protein